MREQKLKSKEAQELGGEKGGKTTTRLRWYMSKKDEAKQGNQPSTGGGLITATGLNGKHFEPLSHEKRINTTRKPEVGKVPRRKKNQVKKERFVEMKGGASNSGTVLQDWAMQGVKKGPPAASQGKAGAWGGGKMWRGKRKKKNIPNRQC